MRKVDPTGQIIAGVLYGASENEAMIIVTNTFHRAHYQERLQMVQGFAAAWRKFNPSDLASLIAVDGMGNRVGRSGVGGKAWVQK